MPSFHLSWKSVSRLARGVALAAVAVVTGASGYACWSGRFAAAAPTAGFWYHDRSLVLPPDATTKLGGPLTDQETDSIKLRARTELEEAFAGLRIDLTTRPDAFWRVQVLETLPVNSPRQLPSAGESLALGLFGGRGEIGFDIVTLNAIRYAPTGASRQTMIEGIGRGLGRVAIHEFTHQILGVAAAHNDADENSYEYPNPDRTSQYYGELHWTTAWPLLQQKFGKD